MDKTLVQTLSNILGGQEGKKHMKMHKKPIPQLRQD